jgi:hypothetical protein
VGGRKREGGEVDLASGGCWEFWLLTVLRKEKCCGNNFKGKGAQRESGPAPRHPPIALHQSLQLQKGTAKNI